MNPQDTELLARYRPYLEGINLTEAQMLQVIRVLVSVSSNLVDEMFKQTLRDNDE